MITNIKKNLPTLAWLAEIENQKVILNCGDGVKINNNFVYEGAICYNSNKQEITHLSNLYFGSGLLHEESGNVIVFCPSHIFDYVWIYKNKETNKITISNSLYYLCSQVDLAADKFKEIPFKNMFYGIGQYDHKIYENDHFEFYLGSCCQFYIKNNNISVVNQVFNEYFNNFEEYHEYLKNIIKQSYISSESEKCIVYLSKGYDSVCCASLAYEIPEIKERVAITRFVDRHGNDDSGVDIANKLGMKLYELQEPERRFDIKKYNDCDLTYKAVYLNENDNKRISYFLTPWDSPQDEALYCDNVDFNKSMVLFGFHGDTIWNYNKAPNDIFERIKVDFAGTSMSEYRLNKGYTFIPVPAIPTVKHSNIIKISKSSEMDPYKLNTYYDRPVARCIAEKYAGLKRGSFANKKAAIVSQIIDFTNEKKTKLMNEVIKKYKELSW